MHCSIPKVEFLCLLETSDAFTSFLYVIETEFSYPYFLVHGPLLMMAKFCLLVHSACKILFFLMELSKGMREKHGNI